MARRIQLNHIQRPPRGNLLAVRTFPARLHSIRMLTVERLRKNTRQRRLTNPARPNKQIRIRNPLRLNRMPQRRHHMRLPNDIIKCHRPILQRQRNMLLLILCHTLLLSYFRGTFMPHCPTILTRPRLQENPHRRPFQSKPLPQPPLNVRQIRRRHQLRIVHK